MYTSCEARRLFYTVIFPKRLSLQSFQHPKINVIFSVLSL